MSLIIGKQFQAGGEHGKNVLLRCQSRVLVCFFVLLIGDLNGDWIIGGIGFEKLMMIHSFKSKA